MKFSCFSILIMQAATVICYLVGEFFKCIQIAQAEFTSSSLFSS